jgi:MSHA biogenesis protein MshM
MYLNHFGLSEFPFALTPDTQFYFDLPSHREALNVLLIALQNGEGFIKITGNVGTGKTMLCRKLLHELQDPFITAYIPNPHLTADGLHMTMADELGIPFSQSAGRCKLLRQINAFLLNAAANQQKPVLIIDEAQAMPLETLEALRLMTNLETEKKKLLQIVLFGQSELDELLQKTSIRQLRQRISFSYALKTLAAQDVNAYIKHRLTTATANINNPTVFSDIANNALHFYSKGIPRLVNILAHKALLSAYGKGLKKIGLKQVILAARDTEDTCKYRLPFECRKSILFSFLLSLCLLITQLIRFYL